jgi:hypothetical protein
MLREGGVGTSKAHKRKRVISVISRPYMGRRSLGNFWTWSNIQMMFCIMLGFLTRTLGLNM